MHQMQLCGTGEKEAGLAGSSSSIWATTREKKDIKESRLVLLILQPVLPPPVQIVDDSNLWLGQVQEAKL